jgi:hypothetical protein
MHAWIALSSSVVILGPAESVYVYFVFAVLMPVSILAVVQGYGQPGSGIYILVPVIVCLIV